MVNQRNKGKRGELEVVKIINKALGTNVRRTPNSGGLSIKGDIIDINLDSVIHDCHLEIKNQNKIMFPKWWKQTTDDCSGYKLPLLIFKHDHKWIVSLQLSDFLYKIDNGENNEQNNK